MLTMDSESDLDESNVYLVTVNATTTGWDEVSDNDSYIDQAYPSRDQRFVIHLTVDIVTDFF